MGIELILLAVVLGYCTVKGVEYGAKRVGRSIAGRYRSGMEKWRDEFKDNGGDTSRVSELGAKAGAATSALFWGMGAAATEFRKGWKEDGWPRGRERAAGWKWVARRGLLQDEPAPAAAPAAVTTALTDPAIPVQRQVPPTDEPTPAYGSGVVHHRDHTYVIGCGDANCTKPDCPPPAAQGTVHRDSELVPCDPSKVPPLHVFLAPNGIAAVESGTRCNCGEMTWDGNSPAAPEPAAAPAAAVSNPVKENTSMAIDTVTGGEVTSLESARAEAAAILAEAEAAYEDAQGDVQRSSEDANFVQVYADSLERERFGANVVAAARAASDTIQPRADHAKLRLDSSERRIAAAREIIAALHTPEGARA